MLGKRLQRVLKAIHVASAGVWLGGLFAIVVLLVVGNTRATGREQFGLDLGAHVVHDVALFWAFVATFVTGVAFATLTSWGTIRHHWITLKWLLAIALFVVTLWFQNPALAILAGLSDAGTDTIGNIRYADAHRTALGFAIGQLVVVVAIFLVSALKPWGERRRDLPRRLVGGIAALGLSIGAVFAVLNHIRLDKIRDLPIESATPSTRADGTWRGSIDDCGLPYEVDVTLTAGRITSIAVVRTGNNQYAQLGAAIVPRIIAAQSAEVDAITGATTTSHCLSRAVGHALHDAPSR